jgi:hypothetical protein
MPITAETLRERIVDYRDDDGLVVPAKPASRPPYPWYNGSGNGLLYTAEYYLTLHFHGALTEEDKKEWQAIVMACTVPGYPGLFRRGPHHGDQQAMDDYTMLLALDSFTGRDISRAILWHGRTKPAKVWGWFPVFWFFNNVEPGSAYFSDGRFNWNAWLGRYPAFRAHVMFAAGMEPGKIHEWLWALTVLWAALTTKKDDNDGWKFTWALVVTMDGKSSICRKAATLWARKLYRVWPGQAQGICLRTIERDPPHPVGEAFKLWLTYQP